MSELEELEKKIDKTSLEWAVIGHAAGNRGLAERAAAELTAKDTQIAEMLEAIEQSNYALDGWRVAHPEEWDGVDRKAKEMNTTLLAKYPAKETEVKK